MSAPEVTKDRVVGRGVGSLIITLFSIVYFADVLLRASGKYFWYDELCTIYMCRLTNIHAMLGGIAAGADMNPPMFHVVTRFCIQLFGENNIGARVPEILGYWIFSLCLYRYASRRAGVVAGTIAMLFPMITNAHYYAYEARPHAIVFGFCGLALVCRQRAGETQAWPPLVGLGAALFGALMMHCDAVAILVPFGLAEVIESVRRRRIWWSMWAALAMPPLLALFVYIPMLRSYARLVAATSYAQVALPGWSQVGNFFGALWAPCTVILLAVLLIVLFDFTDRRVALDDAQKRDLTLAGLLVFLPVVGLVIGRITHGPFFNRYYDSAVGGLAIALGIGATIAAKRRPRAALLIAGLVVVTILVNTGRVMAARLSGQGEKLNEESAKFRLATTPGQPLAMHGLLAREQSGLPIAVVDPYDYIFLAYYDKALKDRLYSVAYAPNDFTLFELKGLKTCCGAFVNTPTTMDEFVKTHAEYLVYGNGETLDQIGSLAMPGAEIESIAFDNGRLLARMRLRKSE